MKVKLGYEIGSGKLVDLSPSHLIVTGLTQKAGKTTTLETLIKRSGKRAIVFRTKIGEKSFLQGTVIPPFFRDRSDWQFIQSLIEATIKERLRSFERAKIIKLAKQTGGHSLLEFKKKIDQRLLEPKLNMFESDILTNIQAYLEIVLPKLQTIRFSNALELVEGLNIIDLERFSRDGEVQSLIIRSVLEEVLYKFKDVIIVIPEAWKFIPQERGNPCKVIVEEFIRQGATNGNYLWIDSQDMAGVDKTPLKQVTEWLLGYQSEMNEVKHTLNQIPLPKAQKPKPDEIMSLGTGVFYLATRERTVKFYLQPFWLDDDDKAKRIALGQLDVSEIDAPANMTPFKIAIKESPMSAQPTIDFTETGRRLNKELSEMATDFFNKIGDIQEQLNSFSARLFKLENDHTPLFDEDTIVRKVLQKIPVSNNISGAVPVDTEAIIRQVLARVPQSSGGVVYEVAPLEMLRQGFLKETKGKIVSDIQSLSNDAKKALCYVESIGRGVRTNEFVGKCFLMKDGGFQREKVSNALKELDSTQIIRRDKGGNNYPRLKDRIRELLGNHEATDTDIQQVYDHVIHDLLVEKV